MLHHFTVNVRLTDGPLAECKARICNSVELQET